MCGTSRSSNAIAIHNYYVDMFTDKRYDVGWSVTLIRNLFCLRFTCSLCEVGHWILLEHNGDTFFQNADFAATQWRPVIWGNRGTALVVFQIRKGFKKIAQKAVCKRLKIHPTQFRYWEGLLTVYIATVTRWYWISPALTYLCFFSLPLLAKDSGLATICPVRSTSRLTPQIFHCYVNKC